MQNGWHIGSLAGLWNMSLNSVNLLDACLHAVYAIAALRQLSSMWAALGLCPLLPMLCCSARRPRCDKFCCRLPDSWRYWAVSSTS